jgi:chromosome segregation protein
MTKINRIVMNGFKSFGKRTEIVFGDNFNCVLGPNGSGKSNVLDALCFVLGKSSSKSLRAEKSSNLIYNGGKSKKPSKQGEVSIYFDNSKKTFPSGEPIIKITRIVKQDGQSVYKINDKTRTRQQIVDLLAVAKINPDAYNIILQGDIVKFVEMSTFDRREIIEEIAGISIYEEKKHKALLELEKVEGKLNEAEIILKERQTYLKELRGERDQALKYKELNEKIKQNKASYIKIQINKKEEEKNALEGKINKHKEELEKHQGKITELKKKIEENKEEIKKITKEVEEKGEKDQLMLQKEIEQIRVDLATNKTRISSFENEINRINQRKEQLQKNLIEIDQKIEELNKEKEEIETRKSSKSKELADIDIKVKEFKVKNKIDKDLDAIEKKIEETDKRIDEEQKKISGLREEQQNLLRAKDKLEYQIQVMDEKIKKVVEIEKEHKAEVEGLKQKRENFKKITQELNKALDESSTLALEISNIESKLNKSKEGLAKLKVQRVGFEERMLGNRAVKKILEQKRSFGRVYGTVSELGHVPSKYSVALEVAAGPKVNSIVVETDEVAAKCIKYLKENRLGRASFLPLNKIKGIEKNSAIKKLTGNKGVVGLAIDLIKFEPQFKNVFSYVFGNTLVVNSIDVARRIGIGKLRMVTLDGDLAETSGAMHGGYRQKKEGAFKEKDLDKDMSDIENTIEELRTTMAALEKSKEENENRIISLREKKATLEGDIIKTERGLHLEAGDLEASKTYKQQLIKQVGEVDKKVKEVEAKIVESNKGLAVIKTEKQSLKDEISELKNPVILAQLNTFEEKKREIREELISIEQETKGIDMQVSEILGRDKENTSRILKDIDKEQSEFVDEIERLKTKIKEQQVLLKEKEEKQKEFYSKFKALFAKRTKIGDEISKLEDNIDVLQGKSRKVELTINTFSLENAKVKAELAGLHEEFAQYEGVELNLKKPEAQLRKEINDFEKWRENMGSVNMRALEIYESVEKEYNTLLAKKDKLREEKEDVLRMMEEIEGKKKELFMKTYNLVNEQFQKIFSLLTTKGQASLELETPDSPFEGGLRIKVRITGNRFMDIRSLSGGEKTLTALAFIFAIQEHEPASFYVLDEVDAALDKHNSEKFAKLISSYAKKAQYIIISHNDSVISEANNLYGVSMNEHGMSNVVSLKI